MKSREKAFGAMCERPLRLLGAGARVWLVWWPALESTIVLERFDCRLPETGSPVRAFPGTVSHGDGDDVPGAAAAGASVSARFLSEVGASFSHHHASGLPS